jgi:hypothetical protein
MKQAAGFAGHQAARDRDFPAAFASNNATR